MQSNDIILVLILLLYRDHMISRLFMFVFYSHIILLPHSINSKLVNRKYSRQSFKLKYLPKSGISVYFFFKSLNDFSFPPKSQQDTPTNPGLIYFSLNLYDFNLTRTLIFFLHFMIFLILLLSNKNVFEGLYSLII